MLPYPICRPTLFYDENRFSQLANRAWSSCCIATNFTPTPFLGSLHCTTARALTSPAGTLSSNSTTAPVGGGSLVRIYKPPRERLATRETRRMKPPRQVRIVPFGEEMRG